MRLWNPSCRENNLGGSSLVCEWKLRSHGIFISEFGGTYSFAATMTPSRNRYYKQNMSVTIAPPAAVFPSSEIWGGGGFERRAILRCSLQCPKIREIQLTSWIALRSALGISILAVRAALTLLRVLLCGSVAFARAGAQNSRSR